MKILGVIPARWESSRFPGKPLADLEGKSMIHRVYLQCKKARLLNEIVVATDHAKILEHVVAFGGRACMTAKDHPSGTDRCQEALELEKSPFDFVVNIQGDEPFIDPIEIDLLCSSLESETEIATMIQKIKTQDQLLSPGEAKVVINSHNEAMYFSRSPIPFVQGSDPKNWASTTIMYRHVGLYAYRSDVLKRITQLPVSLLEKAESLEQLRWLENGFRIKTVETDTQEGICIDTPADLERAREQLRRSKR